MLERIQAAFDAGLVERHELDAACAIHQASPNFSLSEVLEASGLSSEKIRSVLIVLETIEPTPPQGTKPIPKRPTPTSRELRRPQSKPSSRPDHRRPKLKQRPSGPTPRPAPRPSRPVAKPAPASRVTPPPMGFKRRVSPPSRSTPAPVPRPSPRSNDVARPPISEVARPVSGLRGLPRPKSEVLKGVRFEDPERGSRQITAPPRISRTEVPAPQNSNQGEPPQHDELPENEHAELPQNLHSNEPEAIDNDAATTETETQSPSTSNPTPAPEAVVEKKPAPRVDDKLVFGEFEVKREIGKGRTAIAYEAVSRRTGQTVCVKVPFGDEPKEIRDRGKRLRTRIETLQRLAHPAYPKYIASEFTTETPYFVESYVRGESLDQIIGNSRIPQAKLSDLFIQLTEALQHAHAHGIVHLGLNARCVRVQENDQIGIIGMCHQTQENYDAASLPYLAPEQLTGSDDVGPKTDVWALGVLLFLAIYRRLPAQGLTEADISRQVIVEGIKFPAEEEAGGIEWHWLAGCRKALTVAVTARPHCHELLKYMHGKVWPRWIKSVLNIFILLILGLSLLATVIFVPGLSSSDKNYAVDSYSIQLPTTFSPTWRHGSVTDLRPESPERWKIDKESATVEALPAVARIGTQHSRLQFLKPLFGGRLNIEPQTGNVEVVYSQPDQLSRSQATHLHSLNPIHFRYFNRPKQLELLQLNDGKQDFMALNTRNALSGPGWLAIGKAYWRSPRIAFFVRRIAREKIQIKLGNTLLFEIDGVNRNLRGGGNRTDFNFGPDWQRIFVELASNEARLFVNNSEQPNLKYKLPTAQANGRVAIGITHGTAEFKQIEIIGKPEGADYPALARLNDEFDPNKAHQIQGRIEFLSPSTLPANAIIELSSQREKLIMSISRSLLSVYRNDRLQFSRAIKFEDGGDFRIMVGRGRFRFRIGRNKSMWFLDGCQTSRERLVMKIGTELGQVKFDQLNVSSSEENVPGWPDFERASVGLNSYIFGNTEFDPNIQSLQSLKPGELSAIISLLKSTKENTELSAGDISVDALIALASILMGERPQQQAADKKPNNKTSEKAQRAVAEVFNRLAFDQGENPQMLEFAKNGFGLHYHAPKIAEAAIAWSLRWDATLEARRNLYIVQADSIESAEKASAYLQEFEDWLKTAKLAKTDQNLVQFRVYKALHRWIPDQTTQKILTLKRIDGSWHKNWLQAWQFDLSKDPTKAAEYYLKALGALQLTEFVIDDCKGLLRRESQSPKSDLDPVTAACAWVAVARLIDSGKASKSAIERARVWLLRPQAKEVRGALLAFADPANQRKYESLIKPGPFKDLLEAKQAAQTLDFKAVEARLESVNGLARQLLAFDDDLRGWY